MLIRLILLGVLLTASAAFADGVGLGATRVIYDRASPQAFLPVINSHAGETLLIKAWIEEQDGRKSAAFQLTMPLFLMKPDSENFIRVVYVGKPLPQDRETLYWINVKAIPSSGAKPRNGENTLQLAMLFRIKLFMRPAGMTLNPNHASSQLRFQLHADRLVIDNPTPYYQTLVHLRVGRHRLANRMVAPWDRQEIALPAGARGSIHYQTINDYGALSTPQQR